MCLQLSLKGPRSQPGKVSLGLIARPGKDQGVSSPHMEYKKSPIQKQAQKPSEGSEFLHSDLFIFLNITFEMFFSRFFWVSCFAGDLSSTCYFVCWEIQLLVLLCGYRFLRMGYINTCTQPICTHTHKSHHTVLNQWFSGLPRKKQKSQRFS